MICLFCALHSCCILRRHHSSRLGHLTKTYSCLQLLCLSFSCDMVPSKMVLFMCSFDKHQTRKKIQSEVEGCLSQKAECRGCIFSYPYQFSRQLWSELLNPEAVTAESCRHQTENSTMWQSFADRISLYLPLPLIPPHQCSTLAVY